jgi:hypothetical protein
MLWENPGFGYYEGYEQDIKLSNVEGNQYKTYLTKANRYGQPVCEPLVKYITTNLPSAYLDTRLDQDGRCDSDKSEVSYTIGTGWAKDILSNKWYANYYETLKGDRDKPVFTVQAQKLSQYPTGCGSEWCTFPNATCIYIDYDPQISRNTTYPYWQKLSNQNRSCK